MRIVVVGLGYVGLSNAVLLAQHNEVIGVDISQQRVDSVNVRKSPFKDEELANYLSKKNLNLSASTDLKASVIGSDYVVVSTPTNYDDNTNAFDTSSVEAVIAEAIKSEPSACIVIKSTIPIGFIDDVRERFETNAIIFSPEFLREGKALYDNLFPSRIIVGEQSERAKIFAGLMARGAVQSEVDILLTGAREAEAIKLFSNAYLAMRVAFFNELDSYAMSGDMNSREIIEGVSLEPRIGNHYNNPSFGYGGYCLPKDTKQLLANYDTVPQNIIRAIVDANMTRKGFLTNQILKMKPKRVGVYRLVMKIGGDNFRNTSVIDIINSLMKNGCEVIVYEPEIRQDFFGIIQIESDLEVFKQKSDVILANRLHSDLDDVANKVFSRDQFNSD